jgi:hypothetical protein
MVSLTSPFYEWFCGIQSSFGCISSKACCLLEEWRKKFPVTLEGLCVVWRALKICEILPIRMENMMMQIFTQAVK